MHQDLHAASSRSQRRVLVQAEGQAVDKKRRFYVDTETLKDAHEGAVFQLSESETKHALRSPLGALRARMRLAQVFLTCAQ